MKQLTQIIFFTFFFNFLTAEIKIGYVDSNEIMNSLEDYQNPEVKPLFVEVAKTEGYPRLLRIKAIQSLENFNDVTVLDDIIPILKVPNNYEFYYEINNLAINLNANDKYLNEIRRLGLEAMGGEK